MLAKRSAKSIARIAKEWAAEARAKGTDGAASANFYESFFESMGLDE